MFIEKISKTHWRFSVMICLGIQVQFCQNIISYISVGSKLVTRVTFYRIKEKCQPSDKRFLAYLNVEI